MIINTAITRALKQNLNCLNTIIKEITPKEGYEIDVGNLLVIQMETASLLLGLINHKKIRYLTPLVRTVIDTFGKLLWLAASNSNKERLNKALITILIDIISTSRTYFIRYGLPYKNITLTTETAYQKLQTSYQFVLKMIVLSEILFPNNLENVSDKTFNKIKQLVPNTGTVLQKDLGDYYKQHPLPSGDFSMVQPKRLRIVWKMTTLHTHGNSSTAGIRGNEPYWIIEHLLVVTVLSIGLCADLLNKKYNRQFLNRLRASQQAVEKVLRAWPQPQVNNC